VLTACRGEPRAPLIRLVDRIAQAKRVEQKSESIDPEILYLKPGGIPAGTPQMRIDLPIEGGRDYVVKVIARDPAKSMRMLVQHLGGEEAENWHRATEERSGERVKLDWREDTPPGRSVLPVVLENVGVVESMTVREAGARDASIVEAAPAISFHGLVDRPVEGAKTIGRRGARRLMESLLSVDGTFEWSLPQPPPSELSFSHALSPRGPASDAPVELRVEFDDRIAWSETRDDSGSWREVTLAIPRDAKSVRFSTRGPRVVAWGDPILRDAPAHHKKVLLVTLDAVRPDHLGVYGSKRPTSPFLDQLAARGARFLDVEAQRSHTWASTTSLLSGRFPQTTGAIARGERPLRGLNGLASSFAEAGYVTARIGSADLPRGQLPGFDICEIEDNDTDVLSRLDAIGRKYADRPLFVWVHLSTAHYPWSVAENVFDPGAKTAITRAEFRAVEESPLSEETKQRWAALYDDAILQMDRRLGATLAGLDDVGFFADSIVAVTADHGTHLGEHGIWFLHSTPWHASLAVPLFIVAPGRIAPAVVKDRALLVDVAPTLLELAGLPADDLDGVNLFGDAARKRVTVTRFDPASYVIVEDDRWKLLWNPKKESLGWPGELQRSGPLPEVALYERLSDETKDVSSEHPDVVAQLKKAAEEDRASHSVGGTHLSTEARRLLQQAGYLDEKN
jgi:arylsulfatase A-like enzyme